jgi:hypothetical protein
VPHFEKMLYDNAQLIGLYADDYAITREPLARDMAADLAGYLARPACALRGRIWELKRLSVETVASLSEPLVLSSATNAAIGCPEIPAGR